MGCSLHSDGLAPTGKSPPERRSPELGPTNNDEVVPIRFFNAPAVRVAPRSDNAKRRHFAVVQWEEGPGCSRATVQGGRLDRIDVSRRNGETVISMSLPRRPLGELRRHADDRRWPTC